MRIIGITGVGESPYVSDEVVSLVQATALAVCWKVVLIECCNVHKLEMLARVIACMSEPWLA